MRLFCHSKAASEILHALGFAHLETLNLAEATGEIAIHPRTIEDMLDAVLTIGDQINQPARATDFVVKLRGRLHAAQDFINPYLDGPSVLILEALEPLRVPGLWVPQLVERAGGRFPWNPTSAVEEAGAAAGPQMAYRTAGEAVTISPAQGEMHRPEFVVFAIAGLSLDDARAAVRPFTAQSWFQSLPAASKSQVAIIAGDALATPGPGLVDAFEFLVGFLNGREELIPQSMAWERL
ncbi:MAG: hypothetical protein KDA31_02800 [Phycisphaerales bacterium]|nr:hypothetical protein [Phycisphaerales bacterium]MCB9837065.1 hypothetical protein [Phycisphaera sp.]